MSNMKCPKCGGKLVYWGATGALLKCSQCKFGWGNEELWQELIRIQELLDIESSEHSMCHTQMLKTTEKLDRTRKALEIAWDGLEKIGSGNIIEHSVVGHEDDNKIFIANKALDESKTALEQKDK